MGKREHPPDPAPDEPRRAPRALLVALIAYALVACAMTWPLARHALSATWLGVSGDPGGGSDLDMKLWDRWYLATEVAREGASPFGHTRLLFHPEGVSLAFHSLSLVHAALAGLLGWPFGFVSGFNLAALAMLIVSAMAAFACFRDAAGDDRAAFLGGLLFAFNPWTLGQLSRHPDLMGVFGLPFAVLAFARAVRTGAARWILATGLAVALLVYTGLYLAVAGTITLLVLAVALGARGSRWRSGAFWRVCAGAFAVGTVLVAPRIVPMLGAGGDLDEVVESKYEAGKSHDALSLVLPCRHPLLAPAACRPPARRSLPGTLYLGWVPLALGLLALASSGERRRALGWLALAGLFLVLTLGSVLVVGGERVAGIALPREWLGERLPVLQAVRNPRLFFPGALLPLAAAATLGATALLRRLPSVAVRNLALVALSGAALGERWVGPFVPADLEVSPFYAELRRAGAPGALVELPLGRSASKRYLRYQIVHGRPIVEGAVSRAPVAAYATIEGNALLRRWRRLSSGLSVPSCTAALAERQAAAARRLDELGFGWIVLHGGAPTALAAELEPLSPAYRDPALTAYRVADLISRPPCAARSQR